ncbi:MAG: type II secretion system protein J [Syntrophales bacterium]
MDRKLKTAGGKTDAEKSSPIPDPRLAACRVRRRSGFTLIEVLIALSILAIVVSTIYASYSGTLKMAANSEYAEGVYSMARATLERMIRDLESVGTYQGDYRFFLTNVEIDRRVFPALSFNSSAHLAFSEKEAQSGIALIQYYVEKSGDGNYVLLRKDILREDPESAGAQGFILCERLHSIVFKLLDRSGKEYDAWDSSLEMEGQKNRIPSAVQIDLKFENPEREDRPYHFMTRVRLGAS